MVYINNAYFERVTWYKVNIDYKGYMASPIVITYDNAPTEATHYFIRTLEQQGWQYKLIGEGDKWEGWVTRMRAYRKELDALTEDQIVVLSDARDVVCVRSPKAFIDGFHSFKKDIVVSMEITCGGRIDVPDKDLYADPPVRNCRPLMDYWKYHNVTKLPNRRFVNNGLVAGTVKALKIQLDWVLVRFGDDQVGMGYYINEFPDCVGLDIDAELLHTSNFGLNAGVLYIHNQKHDSPTLSEMFGRGAFFLHFSGFVNKGQTILYNTVKSLIDMGTCDELLRRPYGCSEPKWNEPGLVGLNISN